MKKYKKPVLNVEQFTVNEFIAACGDSGKVYNFKCDAGNRNSEYHVYLNGPDGIAHTNDDIDWSGRSGLLRTYHPCGTTHQAESDSGFYNGYMYKVGRGGSNTGSAIDVVVWTNNGTNTHCTTNLDIKTWETAKS